MGEVGTGLRGLRYFIFICGRYNLLDALIATTTCRRKVSGGWGVRRSKRWALTLIECSRRAGSHHHLRRKVLGGRGGRRKVFGREGGGEEGFGREGGEEVKASGAGMGASVQRGEDRRSWGPTTLPPRALAPPRCVPQPPLSPQGPRNAEKDNEAAGPDGRRRGGRGGRDPGRGPGRGRGRGPGAGRLAVAAFFCRPEHICGDGRGPGADGRGGVHVRRWAERPFCVFLWLRVGPNLKGGADRRSRWEGRCTYAAMGRTDA
jgi:hypothetical protein